MRFISPFAQKVLDFVGVFAYNGSLRRRIVRLEEALKEFEEAAKSDLADFIKRTRKEAEERPDDYADVEPCDLMLWYAESF